MMLDIPFPPDVQPTTMRDPLYTVQEVADYLRLNPQTVRRWIRRGALRAFQMGSDKGGYRISRSAMRQLLEERS